MKVPIYLQAQEPWWAPLSSSCFCIFHTIDSCLLREVWTLAWAGAVLLASCGSSGEFSKVSPGLLAITPPTWVPQRTGTLKCIYYKLYRDWLQSNGSCWCFSRSLENGTEVQLCSVQLGTAIRALGYPFTEGKTLLLPFPCQTFENSGVNC